MLKYVVLSVGVRWLCCVVLLAATAAIAAEQDKPTRLRVLSYNIHHAEGVDGKLDLERIARVINTAEADIVALQEVDRLTQRTKQVDQGKELARLTGMSFAFGANIDLQSGTYGNAVLSKYRIVRHHNHALPCFDKGEQRGVLETEIELAGAERLLLLATHFDHRRDDRERVASAKQINALIRKQDDLPALLLGDLNDVLGSAALSELQQQWTSANREPLPTIPVDKPKQQIDFVLFYPQERWVVIDVKVLDEAIASDHRPILAVLELRAATAKTAP